MQSRLLKRSLVCKKSSILKLGLLFLTLFAAMPGQAIAQSCNPSLDISFTQETIGPYFLNDVLRIRAELGAGEIAGGNTMDIHTFGHALDCALGDDFGDCTAVGEGNTVQLVGNVTTECKNANGEPIGLLIPQSNIIPIRTNNGPIRVNANSTCGVEFDILVEELSDPLPLGRRIVQAMGWPVPGTPDEELTRCDNGLTNAASSTLAFRIDECGIDLQKEVSVDGVNWLPAESAQSAPDLEIGATAFYRLVVTNTGTVAYAAPITINDPQLGIVNVQSPVIAAGGQAILTGNEIAQLTKEGRCTVVGSLQNTATVDAMCRTGDNPVGASSTNSAYLECTQAPAPSIDLVKTANPKTYGAAGTNINYTFAVINTGNVTLTDVYISDPLPGLSTPSCPRTTLGPAESMNCTAFYTTTQADVDAGRVDNIATAHGTPPVGPEVTDSDPETITSNAGPLINIVKTASPQTYSASGVQITYTFEVTNTGGVTLSNVNVTDPLPGLSAPSCPQSILAPNESMECTASYTTTQADVDAGRVDNLAAAHGTPPSGPNVTDSDPETIIASSAPSIELVKIARPKTYEAAGERITYLFRVTNTSNVTLTNVNVTDPLPGLTTPVCRQTTLAPAQKMICRALYETTQADVDAGRVDNLATAHGTPPTGPEVTDDDPETITTIPAPALTLVKTATPITYNAVGNVIDYSFLVTNTGNVTIANLTVEDDKADDENCPVASLAPTESTICTATYTISQSDLDAGSVTNIAFASGTDPEDNPVTSPPDDETVTTVFEPVLAIDKTASPKVYRAVGEVIDYDYLVTNNGNVTINDLAVVDDKAFDTSCPVSTLAPTEFTNCSATYTITQDDLNTGFVTNIAYAAGTITVPDEDGPGARTEDVISPTDTETVIAIPEPALTIEKSSVTQSLSAPQTVIYDYLVTNTGNVELTNLALDDSNDNDDTVCDVTTLPVGDSTNCTASHTFTQEELDRGYSPDPAGPACDTGLYNFVLATTDEGAEGNDELCIDIVPEPALTIEKSSVTQSLSAPQTVIYDYLVTNTGNVELTNLALDDSNDNDDTVCDVTTLPVGDSTNCTASHTFTQEELDRGYSPDPAGPACDTGLYNFVLATTDEGAEGNDELCIDIVPEPALTIEKSSVTQSLSAPQTVIYDYLVTNTGNVELTNLALDDSNDNDDTVCDVTTLPVGDSTNCTASHTFTQEELDRGYSPDPAGPACDTGLYNFVLATTDEGAEGNDELCIDIVPEPALTIEKSSVTQSLSAPQTVIYDYLVTNTGNVELTNLALDDSNDNDDTVCDVTTLPVGDSTNCTASHTFTQEELDRGYSPDPAGPACDTGLYNFVLATTDEGAEGNDELCIDIVPEPALTIEKSSVTQSLSAPQTVIYDYLVTNTGNVELTNLALDDSNDNDDTVCDVTTLPVGDSTNCTASHTFTQEELDRGYSPDPAGPACDTGLYNFVLATTDEGAEGNDELCIDIVPEPALTIEKSSVTQSLSAPQTVIYDYLVTNTGNVELTNLALDDSNDNDDTVCDVTTLPVGDSTNCTASHTFTQEELDRGYSPDPAGPACDTGLYNFVLATTDEGAEGNDELCIDIVPEPALTIEKSSVTQSLSAPQTVIYDYLVTNTGNVELTNLALDDSNDNDDTVCDVTTLPVGDSTNCTASHTFTQEELDRGYSPDPAGPACDTGLYNFVLATTDEGAEGNDELCIDIVPEPALTIEKSSVTQSLSAPQTVIYDYLVTNTGNVELTNLALDDSNDNDDTVCDVTTLPVGDSTNCTASHTFTQEELDRGYSPDPAGPACDTGLYNFVLATTDEGAEGNDELCIDIVPEPALTIEKSSVTQSLSAPQTVIYDYLVTNTGNVELTNLALDDSNDNDDTVCDVTTLPVGDSTNCTASHTFTQEELDRGYSPDPAGPACDTGLYNFVLATTDEGAEGNDELCIDIVPEPALTIEKSSVTQSLSAPQTVIYDYLVTNTGNVELTNLALDDSNDNDDTVCDVTTLPVGDSTNCTASHTFTQEELDRGYSPDPAGPACDTGLYNFVLATTDEGAEGNDELCIDIVPEPALTIEKSSVTQSLSAPQTVIYDYLVTNTGNVELTNLALDDSNDNDDTVCDVTTLPVGDSTNCTASHTFTQEELDRGYSPDPAGPACDTGLYNFVLATTDEGAEGNDELCIDIVPEPALTIEKSSVTQSLSAPQTVIYDYLVTNTGNVELTNLALDDSNDNDDTVCDVTTLPVGDSTNCTASHTFTQEELDRGYSPDPAGPACDTGLYNFVLATTDEGAEGNDELCIDIVETEPCTLSVDLQCEVLQPGADPDAPPNPKDACVLFTDPVVCEQRASAMTFRYNHGDCSQSDNGQTPGEFQCTDNQAAGTGPFEIRFSDSGTNEYLIVTGIMPGDEFEVTAADAGRVLFDSLTIFEVYENGLLVQNAHFDSSCSENLYMGDKFGNLQVTSYTNDMQGTVDLNDEVELYFTVTNTGPIAINWIELWDDNASPGILSDDVVEADGTISDEVDPADFRVFMRTATVASDATFSAFAAAQSAIDAAQVCTADDTVEIQVESPPKPPASCESDGKPKGLLFEYTGDDCSASNNEQGSQTKCTDLAALAPDPVQVDYTGAEAQDILVTPDGEVITVGDRVLLLATGTGKTSLLRPTTEFEIKRDGEVLQTLELHTSCSVPLKIGDQFGGLILREFIPK